MAFNSYTFLIFFACILLLHYAPLPWALKKSNLLLASYLFYAAWNPPFVVLLWISTVADWFIARRIAVASRQRTRRLLLVLSLLVNLGLLGFFKYAGFFLDIFSDVVGSMGIHFQPLRPDIVLPVGISFYTFQTLSYTIDVFRGKLRPWHSFLDYALYVTFFPQLVAGPIVRATTFLPQCIKPCRANAKQFGWGLSLLVIGLFEKMVVADGLMAPHVEAVYEGVSTPGMLSAWCATLAFSVQIFCDFAGYSTCAIGAAMCLGFSLPENFRYPYAAIGFSDFWQRWHITLSSWLRDYLYIPLGGNRYGDARTYFNLMMTMLIGGLWHGASWTFVFWGGLHGCYLAMERALRSKFALRQGPGRVGKIVLGLATFVAVCFTWVFFRSDTFGRAFSLIAAMLGLTSPNAVRYFDSAALFEILTTTAAVLILHGLLRDTSLEEAAGRIPWWLRSVLLAVMLISICTMPSEDRAFIYFQF